MTTQVTSHPDTSPAGPLLPQQSLPATFASPPVGVLGSQGADLSAQGNVKQPEKALQEEAALRLRLAGNDRSKTGNGVPGNGANGNESGAETGIHLSAACARLPVSLAVTVPIREFRVRTLLAMAPGEIVETQWGHGEDLPLASGDVQVAWSEFEVVDTRLAVRVTRLA